MGNGSWVMGHGEPPLTPGLFHSQENDDFVGVVDGACLPSSSTILYVFGEIGADTHRHRPYKRMKQPCP